MTAALIENQPLAAHEILRRVTTDRRAEIARQRLTFRNSARRSLEERLLVRFPGLLRLAARLVDRLPPRSRVRKAAARRATLRGYAAANRADFEVSFAFYHPDVVTIYPPDLVPLGFESRSRGLEERLRIQHRWTGEWGEIRFEPTELVDLGDRGLLLGRIKGSGLGSGAPFDREWAVLYDVSQGQLIREQIFLSHTAALLAAGL
jgi:ketosteroid isomerase-like protein